MYQIVPEYFEILYSTADSSVMTSLSDLTSIIRMDYSFFNEITRDITGKTNKMKSDF